MGGRRGERDAPKRGPGGRGGAPARRGARPPNEGARSPLAAAGKPRERAPEAGAERVARVAERVRVELADMLLRGEIRDPRARGALVSTVTITRDLSLARVYLRVLDADASEERKREVVRAFESARGHMRHELAARLAIRSVPDLRFAWDDTTEKAARLDALFAEVEADRAQARIAPAGPPPGGDDEP